MMSNNNEFDIELYRGTTFPCSIQLFYEDGSPFELTEYDKIIFEVKSSPCETSEIGEDALISKILTSSNYDSETESYVFELTPQDTDLPPCTYFYNVGVKVGITFYVVIPPQIEDKEKKKFAVFRVRGTTVSLTDFT